MSYCRWSRDSDVYVFCSSEGLECCGCALVEAEEDTFTSNKAMIEHLELHIVAGDMVPKYAFERLEDPDDAAQNEKIWADYREERLATKQPASHHATHVTEQR